MWSDLKYEKLLVIGDYNSLTHDHFKKRVFTVTSYCPIYNFTEAPVLVIVDCTYLKINWLLN